MDHVDQDARLRALDTQTSFIVQAPAGSGKTELLIQRYLALLAQTPHAPEEVLSITFTRKAAHEMQQRVQLALAAADENVPPQSPHQHLTHKLAKAVLKRDQAQHWHLLQNPHRLRIQTIDGLCASLVHQMPIASRLGLYQGIIEDNAIYETTVLEFLATVDSKEPWQPALAHVLLHLDNNTQLVSRLLVDLLKKRDQWLHHIGVSHQDPQVLRAHLEQSLTHVIVEQLSILHATFSSDLVDELHTFIQFACQHLPHDHPLNQCREKPLFSLTHLNHWTVIVQWLLTTELNLRKTINVRHGFPPTHKAMKNRMLAFLAHLESLGLQKSFKAFAECPPPRYTDEQWQILWDLLKLLPILVAHLKVAFQRSGKVDYTEIALSATDALGEYDSPTELALQMDYKIQHILVDEFQDTSITQFHLLEKLVEGWGNDGRTLFLVGDPMQSIYRFRKAEVGLFVRAKQHGIGSVPLTPLTLSTNFRSTSTIIHWTNQVFSTLFPRESDIATGSIPYTPSHALSDSGPKSCVTLHPHQTETDEIQTIITLIHGAQTHYPEDKIAILVRTRTHLKAVLPALKAAGIAYHATEIETLATQPVILDLMALTRALLTLEDRIAWLAILRAPWCGLNLTDLYHLAHYHAKFPLWDALTHFEELPLSDLGKQQLRRCFPILGYALKLRDHEDLSSFISQIWQLLGGPATITHPDGLRHAQLFFDRLTELETSTQIQNLNQLEFHLSQLYALEESTAHHKISVMTIHKAKGLEFDTVIIPSLHKSTQVDSHELMLWMERPHREHGENLLIAPLKAVADEEHDPIYRYLREVEAQKNYHEIARLFYVAATRAKKRLHLLGQLTVNEEVIETPPKMSLMNLIFEPMKIVFAQQAATTPKKNLLPTSLKTITLQRLSAQFQCPIRVPPIATEACDLAPVKEKTKFDLVNHPIGVLVHRMLHLISQQSDAPWSTRLKQYEPLWRQTLLMKGTPKSHMDHCINEIHTGLLNVLSDPRGRWIVETRPNAHSRIIFSCAHHAKLESKMIDRFFIDEDTHWIILFKMLGLEGTLLTEEELLKYFREVKGYAKLVSPPNASVKLGIYFPFLKEWREWSHQTILENVGA